MLAVGLRRGLEPKHDKTAVGWMKVDRVEMAITFLRNQGVLVLSTVNCGKDAPRIVVNDVGICSTAVGLFFQDTS